MENKEEAVVFGSDVDELQRKEDTEQIKSLAEQVATQVFKDMLAAAVSTSNYSLWQEQKYDVTASVRASREGQLTIFTRTFDLPVKDGFSPAAIRSVQAKPSTGYGSAVGYFYGAYMYGYSANVIVGTSDATNYASFDVSFIITYIRNNLNVPTITIPQ